jgi:hypothetical protein
MMTKEEAKAETTPAQPTPAQAAPAQPTPAQPIPAQPAPAQPPAPKPQEEKQTNCLGCGKPIKKLERYYRNGKFYCSKKCWRTKIAKDKETANKETAK